MPGADDSLNFEFWRATGVVLHEEGVEMRWKIILVNSGIVLILSLVTFFLLKASLATVVSNPKEQRGDLIQAIHAAETQLRLDALLAERWLDRQANEEAVRSIFEAGTAAARSDSATATSNRLRDKAVADGEFARMAPSLVLFVDSEGTGVGRNGSELMRGDKVGAAYPGLAAALKSGITGSALWVHKERQEQMLASYAAVRDTTGKILGAVVLGTPLNDERLSRTSALTSGESIALVVGDSSSPIAYGGKKLAGFTAGPVSKAVDAARAGAISHAPGEIGGHLFAASPLAGFSDLSAVLVGSAPASKVASVNMILWPVFAVGLLGLFLVLTGGVLLGNYLSKPIAEIEEGLLLVINGQQDLRFDLEHDELGGLTSRINGLLNSILGVPEDDGGG